MRHIVQHTCPAPVDSHVVQERANDNIKVPLFPCTAKYRILVTLQKRINKIPYISAFMCV